MTTILSPVPAIYFRIVQQRMIGHLMRIGKWKFETSTALTEKNCIPDNFKTNWSLHQWVDVMRCWDPVFLEVILFTSCAYESTFIDENRFKKYFHNIKDFKNYKRKWEKRTLIPNTKRISRADLTAQCPHWNHTYQCSRIYQLLHMSLVSIQWWNLIPKEGYTLRQSAIQDCQWPRGAESLLLWFHQHWLSWAFLEDFEDIPGMTLLFEYEKIQRLVKNTPKVSDTETSQY